MYELNGNIPVYSFHVQSRAVINLEWTALHYVIPSDHLANSPLIDVLNIVVDAVNISAKDFEGTTFSVSRDGQYTRTYSQQFPQPTDNSYTKLGVSLPGTLLDTSPGNDSSVRIQFIAYDRNSFFLDGNSDVDIIASPTVVACRVGAKRIAQLTEPVEIQFPQFLLNVRCSILLSCVD